MLIWLSEPQKELNITHESSKEIIGGSEKFKNLQSGGTSIWSSKEYTTEIK